MPHSHTRAFFHYDHYNPKVDGKGDIDVRNIGLAPTTATPTQTAGVASVRVDSHEFRVGAVHDLHFGDHFCLDLLAFFEYDKLKQNVMETNSQTSAVLAGTTTFNARESENKIRGFGPGVGFMTRWYAHNPHWHIFAGANTTLIAAENDYHTDWAGTTIPVGAAVATGFYDYEPERSHSLVGKLDINFGIDYRCAFRHELHGFAWDIALGMRYMNMFNAFKNGNTAWNPNGGVNGAFPGNFAANLGPAQDWGRYGPFLKLKIGGAHS
jgi:hypothetical protein